MSYFEKYENLTIYDLVFIGIVSGLIILVIAYLFKKLNNYIEKLICEVVRMFRLGKRIGEIDGVIKIG